MHGEYQACMRAWPTSCARRRHTSLWHGWRHERARCGNRQKSSPSQEHPRFAVLGRTSVFAVANRRLAFRLLIGAFGPDVAPQTTSSGCSILRKRPAYQRHPPQALGLGRLRRVRLRCLVQSRKSARICSKSHRGRCDWDQCGDGPRRRRHQCRRTAPRCRRRRCHHRRGGRRQLSQAVCRSDPARNARPPDQRLVQHGAVRRVRVGATHRSGTGGGTKGHCHVQEQAEEASDATS